MSRGPALRRPFRDLIARKGKIEQDDSGSKVITAADRVRLADELAQAHEQKSRAEEASEPVATRVRSLTAPPVPARSVEKPPMDDQFQ